MSHVDFSPRPSVRMSATRTGPPSGPPSRPVSVTMISSSRHLSVSYVPASQIVMTPAPYCPFGMTPWKSRYSIGWFSVCTARLFFFVVEGMPLGTAQFTSTPSRSRRTSQCNRVAWCSWMTKRGRSPPGCPGLGDVGMGSGVRSARRLAMYEASGPPRASDSAASGSPIRSARSSTSSSRRCRSCGSSSSSQVRGAATQGLARPRSEYGAIVVLLPLFWLQSTNTLPGRAALLMVLTTRSG